MKKIIIILVLCVSCGKNEMKTETASFSSSALTATNKESCKLKCEEAYGVMVEAINANTDTTYAYKQNLINDRSIVKKDCTNHCDVCDEKKWTPSTFTETTPYQWKCTDNYRNPVCGYQDPPVKVYCAEEDYK